MTARQYYYTSYQHQQSGRAGFQIKAMSPGITPETQAAIARLIAYRIPAACDVYALATHPVALRYDTPGSIHQAVLVCSQSCGSDEYGRPGNFFAHALVAERELFSQVAPIFFWKSAFWQATDPQERAEVLSLPLLPASE